MHELILVINAGSSSIKFSVFETAVDRSLTPRVHGEVAGIGTAPLFSAVDAQGRGLANESVSRNDHEGAIAAILGWYATQLGGEAALDGVGHRVVHGGLAYSQPVLIDDHVIPSGRRRPGRPKKLSDAELACLAVAQVLLGARSEHHWLRLCYGRLGHLFPYLPKQPGYHKRVKAAGPLLAAVMDYLAREVPSWHDPVRLIDATPVPCGASRETVRRSELAGWAHYGYSAAHTRWYWGLKLYLITTPDGMPVAWCLADPKLGEREAAAALLEHAARTGALRPGLTLIGDKGFAGRDFEALLAQGYELRFLRPDRRDEAPRHGSIGWIRQLLTA